MAARPRWRLAHRANRTLLALLAATCWAGAVLVAGSLAADPVAVTLASIEAINPPPRQRVRYTGGVGLGANLQRGNSRHTALSAEAHADRKTDRDRIAFRLRWQDAKQERERISRGTFAALKYDYFVSDALYTYATTELFSDTFEGLDLRTVASVGAGYQLFDTEERSLAVEGGLGYLARNFVAAPHSDELTVRLASRLGWQPFGRLQLTDHLVLYPSFEESSVQLRNELSIVSEILASWAVTLSHVLEYDTEPPPGFERADHLFVLGLQYSLD